MSLQTSDSGETLIVTFNPITPKHKTTQADLILDMYDAAT